MLLFFYRFIFILKSPHFCEQYTFLFPVFLFIFPILFLRLSRNPWCIGATTLLHECPCTRFIDTCYTKICCTIAAGISIHIITRILYVVLFHNERRVNT